MTLHEARQLAARVCMGEDFPKCRLREAIAALKKPGWRASEESWKGDREDAGILEQLNKEG